MSGRLRPIRDLQAILVALTVMVSWPFATWSDTRIRGLETIAFGSCVKQGRPQPIWETILAARPDLFIAGGDNIYAGTTDPVVMAHEYARLWSDPGYRRLSQEIPILATWDDHDYGATTRGASTPCRQAPRPCF